MNITQRKKHKKKEEQQLNYTKHTKEHKLGEKG